MSSVEFWEIFTLGEIYTVLGEMLILKDYRVSTGEAVFEDENGRRRLARYGLIRLVR